MKLITIAGKFWTIAGKLVDQLEDWILAAGNWNDTGIWIDTKNWKDE